MAAPVVSLGITNYTLAESSIESNWVSIGGGAASFESDYYIQGTESYTKRVSNGTRQVYNNTANANFSAGDHAYVWLYATGRAVVDQVSNGGFGIFMSDGGSTNYKVYYTGGSDVSLATGWRCFVADPTQTANITNGGSVTAANVAALGGQLATVSGASGRNFAVDAIYVGTGLTITRGESTNAGGFSTITSINDNVNNQYGVFSASDTGGILQGELTIGVDDASTDTYFQENNKTVLVPDKNPLAPTNVNTSSSFTGFSIVGGATTCILTNVSFFTADSHDKGYFSCSEGTNEPARVELDGCTFQQWGPTTLSGFSTATNTTWISCEAITLNSGTLDNCTVETGVGGTYVFSGSTPNNISNTSFIGGGTGGGHGLEITASGSYDFVNNTFSDFGGNNTNDAAIHVNGAGVDVTLNISGADATTAPTYNLTGAGATITYVTAVNVNVTGLPVVPAPQDATEIRVLVAGQDLFATSAGIGTTNPNVGLGTENHRTDTFTFSITKDFDFDLRIINLDYEPQFISSIRSTLDPTNVSANLKLDRVSQNDKQ
jgi:hypothetical protein